MKRVIGCGVLTACLMFCWLHVRPFNLAAKGISRIFHAGREEAKLEKTFSDPTTQEVTNGEAPLGGLRELGKRWSAGPPARRLVLVGNSQTYSVVLAPDETAPSRAPKTYVDLLAEEKGGGGGWGVYRLSAPNLSYAEALWYVAYLTAVPECLPTEIALQLNYESFRKSGIRDGMLELLEEPRFARIVDELAGSSALYAAVLAQAQNRYVERKRERTGDGEDRRVTVGGYGGRAERSLKEWLSTLPVWRAKHQAKSDFLDVLYLSRVYFLGITPTTPRPLGGATYGISLACLDALAERCREHGVVLKLFLAPQNPRARLWRTESDRTKYRAGAKAIADRYALALVDLENIVPAQDWGVWIDGPDPIHFGLRGHQLMAEAVLRSGLVR
jgi:hypothetical protein